MKAYANTTQILNAFFNNTLITKGYRNNEIVYDGDMVTITINPLDLAGEPTQATITFYNYSEPYRLIGNNSIMVKRNSTFSYTINKDNYFLITRTNVVADSTKVINEQLLKKYTITIIPQPLASNISFTVTYLPPDGDYEIDGDSLTAPYGTMYTVEVSKTHYVSYVDNKTVVGDQIYNIGLSLEQHTITVNPTPSDATVTLTASGYSQVGNTITVPYNTNVSYQVSRTGYATISNSVVATEDKSINVTLTKNNYTLTVSTNPSDASVTFSTGTISGKSCTVPYDTQVTYTVSRTGYVTSDPVTINVTENTTQSVTLTKNNYTLTINPNPSDAIVTFNTTGTVVGNSITVPYNTSVNYTVSKPNYDTVTQSTVVDSTKTVNVTLQLTEVTLTINPNPSTATVLFSTSGSISGNSITVLPGTSVTYSVYQDEYITQTNTVTVNTTNTISVILTKIPLVAVVTANSLTVNNNNTRYISISSNNGSTWSSVDTGLLSRFIAGCKGPNGFLILPAAPSQNTIVASATNKILISDLTATNWQQITMPKTLSWFNCWNYDNVYYILGRDTTSPYTYRLYRSTDLNNWTEKYTFSPPNNSETQSINFELLKAGNNLKLASHYVTGRTTTQVIYRQYYYSTDNGSSWGIGDYASYPYTTDTSIKHPTGGLCHVYNNVFYNISSAWAVGHHCKGSTTSVSGEFTFGSTEYTGHKNTWIPGNNKGRANPVFNGKVIYYGYGASTSTDDLVRQIWPADLSSAPIHIAIPNTFDAGIAIRGGTCYIIQRTSNLSSVVLCKSTNATSWSNSTVNLNYGSISDPDTNFANIILM